MKRLVLVGAGHAHARVLLDWGRTPLPGVELVVVSPVALAPYSGMVPGWLSGAYQLHEIVIDFPALCRACGARWIAAELESLDADARRVRLSTGECIDYDVLSLNVGSTLRPAPGDGARMLALRPLSLLPHAYDDVLSDWVADPSHRPWTVTAVGGGAAGVESLLAVLAHLRRLRPDRQVNGALLSESADLVPNLSSSAQRSVRRALTDAGVALHLRSRWSPDSGRSSDLVLWATGAEAHDWQRDPARRGSLAVQANGFVMIDDKLRSVSHPQIFATGDCAHWEPGPSALPKAGVVAVRMGPVLARNLRHALCGEPLQAYRPQSQFLVLLSTADGRAIASRGSFGASGKWAWIWKNYIDRRFLRQYAVAPDAATAASALPTTPSCKEDTT